MDAYIYIDECHLTIRACALELCASTKNNIYYTIHTLYRLVFEMVAWAQLAAVQDPLTLEAMSSSTYSLTFYSSSVLSWVVGFKGISLVLFATNTFQSQCTLYLSIVNNFYLDFSLTKNKKIKLETLPQNVYDVYVWLCVCAWRWFFSLCSYAEWGKSDSSRSTLHSLRVFNVSYCRVARACRCGCAGCCTYTIHSCRVYG